MGGAIDIADLDRQIAQQRADETYQLQARIRQLEDLNAKLAAEIDRMRPVVQAAVKWNQTNYRSTPVVEIALHLDALGKACDTYESSEVK